MNEELGILCLKSFILKYLGRIYLQMTQKVVRKCGFYFNNEKRLINDRIIICVYQEVDKFYSGEMGCITLFLAKFGRLRDSIRRKQLTFYYRFESLCGLRLQDRVFGISDLRVVLFRRIFSSVDVQVLIGSRGGGG